MDNVLWKIGHALKIENISSALGTVIIDSNGKKYHDLESGVWCTPLGHCHPTVNAAISRQLEQIAHTGYCYAHPIIEKTAQLLLEITGIGKGRCLFLTSGSEAVEVGVKAIQRTADQPYLLTLHDSFLGSMGSSGKKTEDEWRLFDWTPCPKCTQPEKTCFDCPVFDTIDFGQISGFVFEPGSSSGFVKFPPQNLIQSICEKVRENNGVVMVNEITTGIGRTGKWFGFQHYPVIPDIVAAGKGLGNGYPVSAAVFSAQMIKKMDDCDFYHSQSHQNDPLGCAAARAVIEVIRDENLIEKGHNAGIYLRQCLERLNKTHASLQDIRSRGLMTAVDFSDRISHDAVLDLHDRLLSKGFIVAKRPGVKTFRIDPPLNIEKNIIDDFIRVFDNLLTEV